MTTSDQSSWSIVRSKFSRRAHLLEAVIVGGAVAVGVVLRFVTSSHMWLDEALSVDIARLPVADIPAALRHDGHPPLFYVLLHFWMRLFGEGDLAVRSFSGVIALGALALAALAARRLAGRDGALMMVGLLALSPFAIRYATEARMYSLVVALVLAGYLLVARALERPSLPRLLAVSAVVGLLLLSHYWALWLAGGAFAVVAFRWRRSSGDTRRATARVLVAVGAGGIFLLPWLPSMLIQSAHTGTPWAATVRPTTMVTVSLNDIGGGDFAEGELLGFALLALAVYGTVRARWELAVVSATLAIASIGGYLTRTTFASRYVAVVFPLFLLAAAGGLARMAGRPLRTAALTAVIALGLVGSVHNAVTDRTQAGVLAAAIEARATPRDLVIVCPDQLGPSMRRLLPRAALVTYPDLGSGYRVDWYDYAKRNAAADPAKFVERALSSQAVRPTVVWLVTSDSYKTLEGQCPAVQTLLSARSSKVEGVVAQNGDAYFEAAGLLRFELAPAG